MWNLFSFRTKTFSSAFDDSARCILVRAASKHWHCRQTGVHKSNGLIADIRAEVRPEHGLMPVRTTCSCHVLTSETTTHHSVVMMFHTTTTQLDVIETRRVTGLHTQQWRHTHTYQWRHTHKYHPDWSLSSHSRRRFGDFPSALLFAPITRAICSGDRFLYNVPSAMMRPIATVSHIAWSVYLRIFRDVHGLFLLMTHVLCSVCLFVCVCVSLCDAFVRSVVYKSSYLLTYLLTSCRTRCVTYYHV